MILDFFFFKGVDDLSTQSQYKLTDRILLRSSDACLTITKQHDDIKVRLISLTTHTKLVVGSRIVSAVKSVKVPGLAVHLNAEDRVVDDFSSCTSLTDDRIFTTLEDLL